MLTELNLAVLDARGNNQTNYNSVNDAPAASPKMDAATS